MATATPVVPALLKALARAAKIDLGYSSTVPNPRPVVLAKKGKEDPEEEAAQTPDKEQQAKRVAAFKLLAEALGVDLASLLDE